jgi:hypothetical protein
MSIKIVVMTATAVSTVGELRELTGQKVNCHSEVVWQLWPVDPGGKVTLAVPSTAKLDGRQLSSCDVFILQNTPLYRGGINTPFTILSVYTSTAMVSQDVDCRLLDLME